MELTMKDLSELAIRAAVTLEVMRILMPFALARKWPKLSDLSVMVEGVPSGFRDDVLSEIKALIAAAEALEAGSTVAH